MSFADQVANMNFAVSKAGLAAGTTTTITIANNTTFAIGGKAFLKSAASNAATPTTDGLTGAAFTAVPVGSATLGGYGCVFVVGLDASGNIKVIQGETTRTTPAAVASATFVDAPEFPAVPDTICPIGYIVTKTDSTATAWTFGSSNLAGPPTGVVHTFVDCLVLPSRPQVS